MKTKIAAATVTVLLLALVAARVLAVTGASRRAADDGPRPPLVPAARVVRGDVAQTVVLTGSIRARNAVVVRPELPGRIASVAVQVGDAVRAGQVLAIVDHDEIVWQAKAARAAVEVARANVDGAGLEHARTKALHDGDAAPTAQLEAAGVRLALARAQLAQAEAAAGLAEEQVRNARVVAPISGVVARRAVDVGAQVAVGAEAFAVEDVSTLKLESAVDASGWMRLAPGAAAEVAVDARPGETFRGKVSVRAPSLDPATRRATVEIEIENASGKLLPGTFARATVAAGRVEGALVAPREAVVDAPGGAIVWRLAGGKAEAVKPRLGASDGRRVVVLDGLAEGDLVATAGQAELAHGGPAEPAAAAEGVRTASLEAGAPGAN
ncbi:MAG TPA: efflux RND transporter periplasmic adaptor subunit [Anaeromyxobacter sp.]|nr:efflux RND transporter periplasmic adaptor subunit [Anaeromyxobacter sp.]